MDIEAILSRRDRVEAFQRRHRIGLLTLLFTDVVGSMLLKEQLGDKAALLLLDEHDASLRETLSHFSEAEEIHTAGDSFFIVFTRPSQAVRFSLLLHKRLRDDATVSGYPILDRIGIHVGEVWVKSDEIHGTDLYGLQVDTASRVASLAAGGQTLLSRSAFDNARQALSHETLHGLAPLQWLNHGLYGMKGLHEPIEVCEVGEQSHAPLSSPPNSAKAWPHSAHAEESVLGWRPAIDQPIPGSSWMLTAKRGEGGFGEVWEGYHSVLKQRCVFKFCFRRDRVRSLKREATLARLLSKEIAHPNIVGIKDVFLDSPPFYLVMDAEGEDLREWCAHRGGIETIPVEERIEIVAQIANALAAAHRAGVVHRDVKPSNILISPGSDAPIARLTDFGIGQVVVEETFGAVTKLGFTETMMAKDVPAGTYIYLAPELLLGSPASAASDIYSLGVVLYQLVVGDLQRPLPSDWGRHVTEAGLREDLARCLASTPEERFLDADELARSLRALTFQRDRTLSMDGVRALLYGSAGSSKFFTLGIAFAVAEFGSWELLIALAALVPVVAYSYQIIARHYPDGGGVYSVGLRHNRLVATTGAIMLAAAYSVTAALSAFAATSFLSLPRTYVGAQEAVIVCIIGVVTGFTKAFGRWLSLCLTIPALVLTWVVIALATPHFSLNSLKPLHGPASTLWINFVAVALGLMGIEAAGNLVGLVPSEKRADTTAARMILPVAAEVLLGTVLLGWALLSLPASFAPEILAYKEAIGPLLTRHYFGLTFGNTVAHIGWLLSGWCLALLLIAGIQTSVVAQAHLFYMMARVEICPAHFFV
jgi:class 3 adenylate cyclase/tRNA A-37 threonylcarbamoyl transferase component Bud32